MEYYAKFLLLNLRALSIKCPHCYDDIVCYQILLMSSLFVRHAIIMIILCPSCAVLLWSKSASHGPYDGSLVVQRP